MRSPRPSSEYRQAKILIVDDEPANVLLLERLLQVAGFTAVSSTTDSGQARRLYSQIKPDLVLLDVHMPEPDGFKVLAQIREETPDDVYVPVVMLTADVQSQVKLAALGHGAKDFLTRPLDLSELMLRLNALLEARFLFRKLERKASSSTPESDPGADAEELEGLAVYFHCKSCGGVHPAPVQFPDRAAMARTHLSANNVFRCPVKKLSARYSKQSLIWREAAQPSDPVSEISTPGGATGAGSGATDDAMGSE